jgi:hypothetical protein
MENYNKVVKNDWGIHYYLNNKLHRLDGPAAEYYNRDKFWYQNGLRHRIDGAAVEFNNGTKYWYQNGLCHRIDGPAIEHNEGKKYWYYKGNYIKCSSQKEFERLIKMKLFW